MPKLRSPSPVPALVAAALTALAAGCVDDPEALDSAEGELVGGTLSVARPEIGRTWGGQSWCTATLIGPQAVLAAAHCLRPQYTATAPLAGSFFTFTDASGGTQTYGVDRVHSFAAWRLEALPGLPFTTDVALLHLDRAVPASEAVPAAIAIQEPYSGDLSTIFGFGCQDRTPPSGSNGGGGFKQFFSFTYPDATRALCAGDSGGPVVYGSETGGGAIWGVNSDWYVGWDLGSYFPDSWTDAFADVPFYRRQIEAVIRGWDGVMEQGVNRPGLDYSDLPVANANVCASTCGSDGNCRAYTYVPEGSGGRCWLKRGAPEPVPGPGLTSGLPNRLEQTFNRGGGDLYSTPTPTADACAATCGRDLACQAFTFVGGTCWIKGSVPAVSYCGSCTSGVPQRGLEVGVNRPGYDLATVTTASARLCAAACAQHERCEAFTFTGAASNNCWLKDAVPGAALEAGMTSGVRRGFEIDTNRAGMDYRSFGLGPSPAICQATCAREAQCQAWSYVPAQNDFGSATCWLKNGVPGPSPAARVVSGVKGLEMVN
jgi:hypothetical protein